MFTVHDRPLSMEQFGALVVAIAHPSCIDPSDPVSTQVPPEFLVKVNGHRVVKDAVLHDLMPLLDEFAVALYCGDGGLGFADEELFEGNAPSLLGRAANAIPIVRAGGWTESRQEGIKKTIQTPKKEGDEISFERMVERVPAQSSVTPQVNISQSAKPESYSELNALVTGVKSVINSDVVPAETVDTLEQFIRVLTTKWSATVSTTSTNILIKFFQGDTQKGQLFLDKAGEVTSAYLPEPTMVG